MLEEIISQELLLQNAKENKIHETEEFIEEVEKIKNNVLKQFALRELLRGISVSDEFVKNYYDENIDSFRKQESWKASHILVDSKEASEKIYQEIQNGKSFADAAAEYSKCPSKTEVATLDILLPATWLKNLKIV